MFKQLALISILILALALVAAEEDSVFAPKAAIAPPGIPGLAESDLSSEQDIKPVALQLTLIDYSTKKMIGDIHVIVEVANDKLLRTIKYVDELGVLKLELNQGSYRITLRADRINTSGSDYYYEQNFELTQSLNESIMLLPVGSARGLVVYNGMAVPSASVKFDCPGSYGDTEETMTDKYGSFAKDYLPTGLCKLFATDGRSVGEASVEIKQGSVSEVEISLNKKIRNDLFITILIIAIIAIGLFIMHYLVVGRKKPRKTEEIKKEVHLNRRINDITKTLNNREKEIVELLLKEGEVNQSKIIHNTAIPKTSIVRIFENLQSKKVIELKRIGKTKKVRLTDWILEKEGK